MTSEEQAFIANVNKALGGAATVSLIRAAPTFEDRQYGLDCMQYGLVMAVSASRRTLWSQTPWQHESPDEIVRKVRTWLQGKASIERYSADPKDAE